jgi:hypothetical protein
MGTWTLETNALWSEEKRESMKGGGAYEFLPHPLWTEGMVVVRGREGMDMAILTYAIQDWDMLNVRLLAQARPALCRYPPHYILIIY